MAAFSAPSTPLYLLIATLTGFGTSFSLILAIGAQNAFVLRQGLLRAHVFWVCLICALSDAFLIAIGVTGIGTIAAVVPWAITALTWAGAAFLVIYGALSFVRAFNPGTLRAADQGAGSLRLAILTCLALTWLNPHVYLDTVGLIGAVSTSFADLPGKIAYGGGAMLASLVFFFALGYGARLLAPVFARPRAWAILDVVIALIMWTIAVALILSRPVSASGPGPLLHPPHLGPPAIQRIAFRLGIAILPGNPVGRQVAEGNHIYPGA